MQNLVLPTLNSFIKHAIATDARVIFPDICCTVKLDQTDFLCSVRKNLAGFLSWKSMPGVVYIVKRLSAFALDSKRSVNQNGNH